MVSAARVVLRGLVGVAGLLGVGGHHQRLAGVGVELLELGHLAVQADLGLLLVGDDVGRLLLQPAVLLLRLGDRLLELHRRIGPLRRSCG